MSFNPSTLASNEDEMSSVEGGIRLRREDPDIFRCEKCQGEYFIPMKAAKYPDSHQVAYSQAPAEKSPQYVVMVCVKCLAGSVSLMEPRLHHPTTHTREAQMYDEFFEAMQPPPTK